MTAPYSGSVGISTWGMLGIGWCGISLGIWGVSMFGVSISGMGGVFVMFFIFVSSMPIIENSIFRSNVPDPARVCSSFMVFCWLPSIWFNCWISGGKVGALGAPDSSISCSIVMRSGLLFLGVVCGQEDSWGMLGNFRSGGGWNWSVPSWCQ